MADVTDVLALPFPEGSDANDVAGDMQALAERLDEAPGVESLTSAQIAALTSPQKPAGRVVYNSTTGKLQISNGTSFADIDAAALAAANAALPKAGGTMSGAIAMGGHKVTGLGAASANGDAVRFEQALLLAGGTMSGKITLDGNPSSALHAVPRQWVDPVYGIGTVGAGQSLTAGQWNVIDGWAAVQSQSMVFTTITFPIAGVWVVTAHASVQYSASPNEKYIAQLVLNGSTVVAQDADFPVASVFDACMGLSAVVNVASADTVGLWVYNGAAATRYLRDARLAATLIAR